MCSVKEQAFLKDIGEAIRRIQEYTENLEYETFLADTKTQDAVVRNLEIIGEATKQLSESIRQQAPHIPWRNIARMRDKLIHHYFGVNLDIVWQVIHDDLTELLTAIYRILPPRECADVSPEEERVDENV
ncbi:MAG: DUF86 domain-containing protein [bacterium]|nr:DUF86 domain-containing protein [bacterium]